MRIHIPLHQLNSLVPPPRRIRGSQRGVDGGFTSSFFVDPGEVCVELGAFGGGGPDSEPVFFDGGGCAGADYVEHEFGTERGKKG